MKEPYRVYDLPKGFLRSLSKGEPLPPPSRGADHSTEPTYDPEELERLIAEQDDAVTMATGGCGARHPIIDEVAAGRPGRVRR